MIAFATCSSMDSYCYLCAHFLSDLRNNAVLGRSQTSISAPLSQSIHTVRPDKLRGTMMKYRKIVSYRRTRLSAVADC